MLKNTSFREQQFDQRHQEGDQTDAFENVEK